MNVHKSSYERQKEKHKQQWKARREAGLCGRCGVDLGSSQKSLCPKCAEDNRKACNKSYEKRKYELTTFYAERYKQRRLAGICVSCGKAPAAEGIARCDVCQQKQREASTRCILKKMNERKAANG